MKKIISITLTCCILLSFMPNVISAQFADTNGHWAQAAIEKWSGYGILLGSDGIFRPDDTVTRGELAAIVNRVFRFPQAENRGFTDITSDHWAYNDMVALAWHDIFLDNETLAGASDQLTREETIFIINNALFGGRFVFNPRWDFIDFDEIDTRMNAAVVTMVQNGFISGFPDGSFGPKLPVTRAQVVTILDNIFGTLISESGEFGDITTTAVTVNSPGVTIRLSGAYVERIYILPGVGDGTVYIDASEVTPRGEPIEIEQSGRIVQTTRTTFFFSPGSGSPVTTRRGSISVIGHNPDAFEFIAVPEILREQQEVRRIESIDERIQQLNESGERWAPWWFEHTGQRLNQPRADAVDSTFRELRETPTARFAGGRGTAETPYLISTQEQLEIMRTEPNRNVITHYQLINDIELQGEWRPMTFRGNFDGGGFTISNLLINEVAETGTFRRIGFFNVLSGTVSNLTIEGAINVTNAHPTNSDMFLIVGGVAGVLDCRIVNDLPGGFSRHSCGQIYNVISRVKINVSGSNNISAGGLVGRANYTGTPFPDIVHDKTIANSASYGEIIVNGLTAEDVTDAHRDARYVQVGGIAGSIQENTRIINSHSLSNITANGGVSASAGGLVGTAFNSAIENSFAAGLVQASGGSHQNNAGGLIGNMQSSSVVSESFATGSVIASGSPIYLNAAGGLAGAMYANSIVRDSYAAGNVSASGAAGFRNVAGSLVGRLQNYTVINSYAIGTVNGQSGQNLFDYRSPGTVQRIAHSFTIIDGVFVVINVASAGATLPEERITRENIQAALDWDFENVWEWNSMTNLPVLRNVDMEQNHMLPPLVMSN